MLWGLALAIAAPMKLIWMVSFVTPGLIDAHVHIESSLVTPPEFARAVLPHGVTSVITDPHEIANVLGIAGIHYMLERAKGGQLNMFVMASSCVPATHMETSGAQLEAADLAPLLEHDWVPGLAELMNYPGVALGDEGMLDKITLFNRTGTGWARAGDDRQNAECLRSGWRPERTRMHDNR